MYVNGSNRVIEVRLRCSTTGAGNIDLIRPRRVRGAPLSVRLRDGARTSEYDAADFRAGWQAAAALAADDLGETTTGEVIIIVRNERGFGGQRTWATSLQVRGSIAERVLDWL